MRGLRKNKRPNKLQRITNTVTVEDGRFEQAFRKFKRMIKKSGVLQECRDRQQYIKPSQARKLAHEKAVRREHKRRMTNKYSVE